MIMNRERIHQQLQLYRHRKMFIEIRFIAFLYCSLHIPLILIKMIQFFRHNRDFNGNYEFLSEFLSYYAMFLFLFIDLDLNQMKPFGESHLL